MAKYKFPIPGADASVAGYVYVAGKHNILFAHSPITAGLIQTEEEMIGSVLNLAGSFPGLEKDVYADAGKMYALVELPTRTSNRLHEELVKAIDLKNAPPEEEKPKKRTRKAKPKSEPEDSKLTTTPVVATVRKHPLRVPRKDK
jgi:hypothetical protein